MTRRGWIYTPDGRTIEKGSPEHAEYLGATTEGFPAFIADEGEFVSPIDRKVYSGRAGMREHNRIHDVVNNRDLVGLPYKTTQTEYKPDRKAIRATIVEAMRAKGVL